MNSRLLASGLCSHREKKKKVKPRARQFPISCVQKYKNVKLNLGNYFISAFGYQRVWSLAHGHFKVPYYGHFQIFFFIIITDYSGAALRN